MASNCLTVVLSGDHEEPSATPERLAYARAFAAVPIQVTAAHTRAEVEQALALTTGRVRLVTSAYHVPRVLETVVAVLQRLGQDRQRRVWVEGVPVSPDAAQWITELAKRQSYMVRGEIATSEQAAAYVVWRDHVEPT